MSSYKSKEQKESTVYYGGKVPEPHYGQKGSGKRTDCALCFSTHDGPDILLDY